jgi:uncharacterized protein (AIM24 family)
MTKENLTPSTVAQVRIKLTDYEEVKANIDVMSAMAERIAYSQSDLLHSAIMAFYSDAAAANKLHPTAVTMTSANVYGYIEEMAVQLDDQNVPRGDNRVLFVKNNVASLIRQSALFDGTAI